MPLKIRSFLSPAFLFLLCLSSAQAQSPAQSGELLSPEQIALNFVNGHAIGQQFLEETLASDQYRSLSPEVSKPLLKQWLRAQAQEDPFADRLADEILRMVEFEFLEPARVHVEPYLQRVVTTMAEKYQVYDADEILRLGEIEVDGEAVGKMAATYFQEKYGIDVSNILVLIAEAEQFRGNIPIAQVSGASYRAVGKDRNITANGKRLRIRVNFAEIDFDPAGEFLRRLAGSTCPIILTPRFFDLDPIVAAGGLAQEVRHHLDFSDEESDLHSRERSDVEELRLKNEWPAVRTNYANPEHPVWQHPQFTRWTDNILETLKAGGMPLATFDDEQLIPLVLNAWNPEFYAYKFQILEQRGFGEQVQFYRSLGKEENWIFDSFAFADELSAKLLSDGRLIPSRPTHEQTPIFGQYLDHVGAMKLD